MSAFLPLLGEKRTSARALRHWSYHLALASADYAAES